LRSRNEKLVIGLILVILLPASISCASTSPVPEKNGEAPDGSWQIDGYWRYSPQSIWGDTLIAGEYVFGNGLEEQYISAYNLRTREKQRLKEIPADYHRF
jgi:hypothetical protein